MVTKVFGPFFIEVCIKIQKYNIHKTYNYNNNLTNSYNKRIVISIKGILSSSFDDATHKFST
jgi:hypothetical protein